MLVILFGPVLRAINNLKVYIMATQAEITSSLQAVTAQLVKIGAESTATLNKVIELQAIIDNQTGGTVSAELQTAVDELMAQALLVDALVEDTPPAPDIPVPPAP